MSLSTPASPKLLQARTIERWGNGLIRAGLGFGLLVLFLVTTGAPDLVIFLPVLLLGGVVLAYLCTKPLLHLSIVLAAYVIMADHEHGIQIQEVAYGLYYFSFLGHWFITRLFLYREQILKNSVDWALMLFLIWATASCVWGIMFGAEFGKVLSEWLALSVLAFYFPVREACLRYEKAPAYILRALLWIAVFVAIQNILDYRTSLNMAEYAWQVFKNRTAENQIILLMNGIGLFVFILYSKSRIKQGVLALFFMLCVIGIVISQSRAVWVAFLLGLGVLFLLIDRAYKIRILTWGFTGVVGLLAVALIFFQDYISLISVGFLDRFASLGSAATKDVSLINRFIEASAVVEHIKFNPIIGYGLGATYSYYSLVYEFTYKTAFIHIAYVALIFKLGVIGFSLIMYFCVQVARRSLSMYRRRYLPLLHRQIGLILGTTLLLAAVAVGTENYFANSEGMILLGVFSGAAMGLWEKDEKQSMNSKNPRPNVTLSG